jgi:preprotein translocase subunit SecA
MLSMSKQDVSWTVVVILTDYTKRLKPKRNVKIEAATQTFATVTLQNYFRMYNKLAGMTGTAVTGELWEIYKLDVVEIPTNRPMARHDKEDFIYKTTRENLMQLLKM